MDQFAQMKTTPSPFCRARQEKTRIALCNYLSSCIEVLEDIDFHIFQKRAMKLLCNIQSVAEKRTRHPQIPRSLHFQGAPVPPPHICYILFNNQSNQHQLLGTICYIFQRLKYQQIRSLNLFSRAKWHPEDSSNLTYFIVVDN